MIFLRAADATAPLTFEIEELQSGRTFTALLVHVRQGDRRCASATMLLDVTAGDVMRHTVPLDLHTGPPEAEPLDLGVTGREVRIVEDTYTDDPDAPVGPPVIDAWVRYASVPDDPLLHAGLLAQFTGRLSIASAMRPHRGVGQAQAHRTLSTAVNAIALSLHADVRADDWLLYRHHATFAGDGMTHAEGRVHAARGDLIASFAVDAMVRSLADPAATGARPVL